MMARPVSLYWFRQDLRLADNPALCAAAAKGAVLPVYILDDDHAGIDKMGSASRWWLHHSLAALNRSLDGKLVILRGDPATHLAALATQTGATSLHWNRCYEPWRIARDQIIKADLTAQGLEVTSHNGSLLWEPWDIAKADGTPYRVFTPYYRKGCLAAPPPRQPLPVPAELDLASYDYDAAGLDGLSLLPDIGWDDMLVPHWNIGEAGALAQLADFIDNDLEGYKDGRNFPALPNVSRLSPYLHWGEVSPNRVWYAAKDRMDAGLVNDRDADHFLSELGWREFSYALLYYFPDLPRKNLQPRFDRFPWKDDDRALRCWQRGQTGYPIVDAAMRQLWQTGYMHNRLRMIVGSFLVKNLRLHWHHGEAWFWDCLVDADLANNSASWQWIAGCGADAAPYFRIFNPITQGLKFDPDGRFVRQYVPEIAALPDAYLFSPWDAPQEVLAGAGVALGTSYPRPMVDVKASREDALAAFAALKDPA
jgi:deoxyribodipyrimidine photo-lyase